MTSDKEQNSRSLERSVEFNQRIDNSLDKAPDADAVRNADQTQLDAAIRANDDIWRSEGHFAITENGETVAKQTSKNDSAAIERKRDLEAETNGNADTSSLKAILADSSLPDENRFLASQLQEMRTESKSRGLSTDVIDEIAGQQLADEIRSKRALDDRAGTLDAETFRVADIQNFSRTEIPLRAKSAGGESENCALVAHAGPEVSLDLARQTDSSSAPAEQVDRQMMINSTKVLVDGAMTKYDPQKIRDLKIAPDDIGTAYELYWVGPDAVKSMGRDQARTNGRRALAFGVMPIMGAIEKASTEFSTKPGDVIFKGGINAVIGTGVGAILELCNPAVGIGLGSYSIYAIYSEQTGPENHERNQKLAAIDRDIGSMSPDEFVRSSKFVKSSLGPLCYDAIFGLATGGIGVPGGMGIGGVAKEGAERSFTKSFFDGLVEKIKSSTTAEKLGKLLPSLRESPFFNPGKHILETAPEGPGLTGNVFEMGRHKGDGGRESFGKRAEIPEAPYKRWSPHDLSKLTEHPRVQEMFKNMRLTDGKINVNDGVDVCDIIAESLRNQVPRIDDHNIAFAVIESGGEKQIVWALAGGKKVPGIQPPDLRTVPEELKPVFDGIDRQYDSEYKILLKLYSDLTGDPPKKISALSMFTEQEPCSPSCQTAVKAFRKMFGEVDFPAVEFKYTSKDERRRVNWNKRTFSGR